MKNLIKTTAMAAAVLSLAGCSAVRSTPVVPSAAQDAVRVYAAGSLRGVLTAIAKD